MRDLFRRKKEEAPVEYDRASWTPAVRRSICTGEREGGLRNLHTGQFRSECCIRTQKDLEAFQRKYGVDHLPEFY